MIVAAKMSPQEAYNELAFYTLSHPGTEFIHQNLVDAFTAQNAGENTKPIAITFALIGLYLSVEKGFTGRQVQLMHMRLAKSGKSWPEFELPEQRGNITVFDVLATQPGKLRDQMIGNWCVSVWSAFQGSREKIVGLLQSKGLVPQQDR
jgi:Family of unknown function (DUF5946)